MPQEQLCAQAMFGMLGIQMFTCTTVHTGMSGDTDHHFPQGFQHRSLLAKPPSVVTAHRAP